MVLIAKTPLFHNAFGYICFSHLIADTAIVSSSVYYTGPATFFGYDISVTSSFIGKRVGQVMQLLWYQSTYSHLQIAINRLAAVAWPLMYGRLFSGRKIFYFIGMFWFISFCHSIVFSWEECSIWFDTKLPAWTYHNSTCAVMVNETIAFIYTMAVFIAIVSINTTTFVFIRKEMKVLRRISGASAVQSLRKLRTNKHLYIQGCVSAAIMIFTLYAVQFIRLTTTKHLKYFLDTLAWELVQMSNGIVLIIFNKPFRDVFRPKLGLNRSPVVNPRTAMTFS